MSPVRMDALSMVRLTLLEIAYVYIIILLIYKHTATGDERQRDVIPNLKAVNEKSKP